jgi:hypothetical protein
MSSADSYFWIDYLNKIDPSLVNNFVGSAAGALAGAFAAFGLEARRRKKENTETQRSKLLHAQFLFAQKINSIINLKNHLANIPPTTNSIAVSKMTHITIDERVSARDLEPMIDGQWADKATDILRFDRTYAEAAEWLARFNQQKDLISFHPNTKIFEVDWEQAKVGAAVDVPLVMELNFTLTNLRASVEHAHQKLPEGLELLKAFMKENYPGRRTIGVSPTKQ